MKAKRLVFYLLYPLFLSVVLPASIFAHPVINEFSAATSDDWIEIYNPDDTEIDLSKYKLRDNSATNTLDLTGIMPPHTFLSFEWAGKLNNGGDILKLILISEDTVIDEVGYGGNGLLSFSDITETIGRKRDGDGDWAIFSQASKRQSNNNNTIINTPTPSPTPSPTPTRTPTPTRIPTPTKMPTPTSSSITVSVLGEDEIRAGPMGNKKITPKAFSPTAYPEVVLSTSSGDLNPEENEEEGKSTVVKRATAAVSDSNYKSFIIMGGALLLISCGILIFLRQK